MRLRRTPRHMPGIARGLRASWQQALRHLHLDLGCGKGTYLVERATREPNTLFVGMDQEPICIAYAAQKICEQELTNALVLPRGATSLPQLFAAGELDAITVNFPTPQPKAKYAKNDSSMSTI